MTEDKTKFFKEVLLEDDCSVSVELQNDSSTSNNYKDFYNFFKRVKLNTEGKIKIVVR